MSEPTCITTLRAACANNGVALYDANGYFVAGGSAVLGEYDAMKQRAEAAEAERDAAWKSVDENWVTHQQIIAMRNERDALRTDAERYRHMRNRHPVNDYCLHCGNDYCLHCGYDGLSLHTGVGLDVVVDESANLIP